MHEELITTADELGKAAVFLDYLAVLATGAGEPDKAERINGQAATVREVESLYRTVAAS